MPNKDGTGPFGNGLWGRGMGPCGRGGAWGRGGAGRGMGQGRRGFAGPSADDDRTAALEARLAELEKRLGGAKEEK